MPRKSNVAGINIIKYYESLRLTAYKDIKGTLTIGYGHVGHDVTSGQTITEPMANLLLVNDMSDAERAVERLVKVKISDNQFSALVSLVFNIGQGQFESSTLLKVLNRGDFRNAAKELLRWDKASGKEVSGLLARRRAEAELFNKEDV